MKPSFIPPGGPLDPKKVGLFIFWLCFGTAFLVGILLLSVFIFGPY